MDSKDPKVEQLLSRVAESVKEALRPVVVAAIERGKEEGKKLGVEMGVQQERERVIRAINSDAALQPSAAKQPAPPAETAPPAPPSAGYSELARRMLAQDRKKQFGIQDGVDHFKAAYRVDVSPEQMRAILKVLARQEEAERVDRGQYRAGPKLERRADSTAH